MSHHLRISLSHSAPFTELLVKIKGLNYLQNILQSKKYSFSKFSSTTFKVRKYLLSTRWILQMMRNLEK